MKLFYISPYPPKEGGLSVYSKRNVDYLNNLKNVEVMVHPFNSITSWVFILKLIKFNPDFVRIEYNIPAYGFGTFFLIFQVVLSRLLIRNTKFLIHYHEVKRETDLLGVVGKLFYKYFSMIFDGLFVHTKEAKNILVSISKDFESKTFVIPLGTLMQPKSASEVNTILEKYKLHGKNLILFFGYIHIDKGIQYLIDAFETLCVRNPEIYRDTRLIIAGDVRKRSGIFKYFGSKDRAYKKMLVEIISKSTAKSHIKLLGSFNNDDIDTLLRSSKLVVIPYTNVEQSGVLNLTLPYLKPIIASDIGGLGETLSDAGVLVKPKDSDSIYLEINKLLIDEKYYGSIVSKYEILSKKLDVSEVTNSYLRILN